MNRREVKDFCEDRKNWEAVDGNDWVRFTILTVGVLQFGRVEIKQVTNIGDIIIHQAEPVTDFRPEGTIYEIDKKNKCVNYGISFTSLSDRVWKEFKRLEEARK